MPSSFSVSALISDLSADLTTIGLDLPNGGYDQLHRLIESKSLLPTSKKGRLAVIAVILLASRMLKQRLGPLGPVANFINEIKDDGIREEAKRILETVISGPAVTGESSGEDALWAMSEPERSRLLSLYGELDETQRQQLRARLTKSTAVRLASIARLSPDELALVLELVSPHPATRMHNHSMVSGPVSAISEFFFPWTRPRTGVRT